MLQATPTQPIIYGAINQPVLSRVPVTTRRVLDIGCGSGELGKQIKQNINCEVVGVTYSESELALASQWLDRVFLRNLNSFDLEQLGSFDCIICSHVLEHLYQPQELLNSLRSILSVNGVLIVALPNVLHWKQRLEFMRGKFKYTDGGLMDRTHFRFFDWETSHELLENNGYKIIDSTAKGNFPLPGIRNFIDARISLWFDEKAVKQCPGLFGFQFVFTCCSSLMSNERK